MQEGDALREAQEAQSLDVETAHLQALSSDSSGKGWPRGFGMFVRQVTPKELELFRKLMGELKVPSLDRQWKPIDRRANVEKCDRKKEDDGFKETKGQNNIAHPKRLAFSALSPIEPIVESFCIGLPLDPSML